MAVRKPEIKESGYYFITFTCFKWLPLFERAKAYDLVYKWFDYMSSQNHRVIAYVIMPNHLHLLLAYKHADQSLNKVIGNGKRFLAYGIVKNLQQMNAHDTPQWSSFVTRIHEHGVCNASNQHASFLVATPLVLVCNEDP